MKILKSLVFASLLAAPLAGWGAGCTDSDRDDADSGTPPDVGPPPDGGDPGGCTPSQGDEGAPSGECSPPPTVAPVCGNGIVEAGEQCDDGNADDTDACGTDCKLCPAVPPGCGNGVVELGEECDDGNANDADGCSNTCRIYIG